MNSSRSQMYKGITSNKIKQGHEQNLYLLSWDMFWYVPLVQTMKLITVQTPTSDKFYRDQRACDELI